MTAALETTVLDLMDRIRLYSTTGDRELLAGARRDITELHRTHPSAADSLWAIAIHIQRTLMEDRNDSE